MSRQKTRLHPFFAKIISFFESLTLAILSGEGSVIEFLVAIGLWAAYLTPAHMTYVHVVETLNFHRFFGLTTAAAVEILGIASGHTLAKFYQHNKDNRAKRDQVSLWPLVFTYGLYLAIITAINVVLDWNNLDSTTLIARVGLILLTTPAIIIVAVRAQHREILSRHIQMNSVAPERSEQRVEQPKRSRNVSQTKAVARFLSNEYNQGKYGTLGDIPTARQLANELDVAPSSAQRAREKFITRMNGNHEG